jgi:hypothetical protein
MPVNAIADDIERWLEEEGSDGFNIIYPYRPAGLDDVVDRLIPELQPRRLFRTEYEGATLRETRRAGAGERQISCGRGKLSSRARGEHEA